MMTFIYLLLVEFQTFLRALRASVVIHDWVFAYDKHGIKGLHIQTGIREDLNKTCPGPREAASVRCP